MTRQTRERMIEALLFASAVTAVLIVVLIMVFLFKEGAPFLLKYGIHTFCLGMEWNPIAMDGEPSYGIKSPKTRRIIGLLELIFRMEQSFIHQLKSL